LDGVVNKQNVRFLASENPHVTREMVHHAECGLPFQVMTAGPIFFEQTVNSEHYLSTLHNTFMPHLLATGLPLQTQWFMQDGARPRTVNIVLDFLHDIFDSLLNPRDFFLRGFLKEKIFPKKPRPIMKLRALIIQACSEIAEDTCHRVINTTVRVEEVARWSY
jgi:hypothetical protein